MDENCQSVPYIVSDDFSNHNFGPRCSQDAMVMATKSGWSVKHPADNELFIDIDDRSGYIRFVRARKVLREFLEIKEIIKTPSKSGKPSRFHITVRLEQPITPLERILLQALFGSDQMREIFSYQNLKRGDSHPTLFFEK